MDKNQITTKIDSDSTFLSLTLNERLYLNDSCYSNKNGFNIFKPQAQKSEPLNYYQQELNPKNTQQTNSLQQIDQFKNNVFLKPNPFENQKKHDLEELNQKLEQIRKTLNELSGQLGSLEEKLAFDLVFNKLKIVDDLNQKFDKIIINIPSRLESLSLRSNLLESKLNESLSNFYFRISEKLDSKFRELFIRERELPKVKKEKKVRLNSFKKKRNQYELLTKLKTYKQLVLKSSMNELDNYRSNRCIHLKKELDFESNQMTSSETSCIYVSEDKDLCDSSFEFDF